MLGFPNAGKTTLFNRLTGAKQKIVNYPGSTVDFSIATIQKQPSRIIIDSPGVSSFFSDCCNERLTLNCLKQLKQLIPEGPKQPDLVLVVIDATKCQAQLSLVKQLKDHGYPIVVAITMMDDAKAQGLDVDTDQLSELLTCPVLPVSIHHTWEIDKLNLACSYQLLLQENSKKPTLKPFLKNNQAYFKWSESTAKKIYNQAPIITKITQTLDRIFLNPVAGCFLFFSIMALFFCSLFLAAAPFMDLIDWGFSTLMQSLTHVLPTHWLSACFIEGGVGGLAAIFIFIPQIALLFLGLGLLESSGYLARAAVIIDKPMSLFGLSGRSFVPLLSGCACAIPALLATRNIASAKERFLCQWIIPLMQCSARLPVYGLLLALLFPKQPMISGLALTAIYILSFLLSGLISLTIGAFDKTKSKDAIFCLELPKWRQPQLKTILSNTYNKCKDFVVNAGPLILIISFVLWLISTFPTQDNSIAMWMGQWIEPIFAPLGLDWRCGVAILLSFAAREVFVSVLGVMFAAGSGSLFENLALATQANTGELLFNTASILSLLVFFMIALQCGSTVAVAKREMNSSLLATSQVLFYFVLAYVLAFMVQLLV
eukprot:COSAG01_NODE_547_length_15635_cov_102.896498_7_plen_599_part_00